jgi:TPR repeat protein
MPRRVDCRSNWRSIKYLIVMIVGIVCSLAAPGSHAESLEDGYAAWNEGDYQTALNEWLPLAQSGDVDAQSALGFMYYNGQGVQQDYPQAFAWYRRAAAQGSALAQNNLALMYANGNGVKRDDVRALMWFNLAAVTMESDEARNAATANRDNFAKQLTPDQVERAQAMAWRCQQTKFKECD